MKVTAKAERRKDQTLSVLALAVNNFRDIALDISN